MPNYNKVILLGNLTRDPELRYTPSGLAVADLSLAVNRRSRSAEGERRDSVVFVEVTAWGKQAELINEYYSKGQPIFIEGRLSLDEWTGKDGQRRSKLRVVLEKFEFLNTRGSGRGQSDSGASREEGPPSGGAPPPSGRGPARPEPTGPTESPEPEDAEPFDDVPF